MKKKLIFVTRLNFLYLWRWNVEIIIVMMDNVISTEEAAKEEAKEEVSAEEEVSFVALVCKMSENTVAKVLDFYYYQRSATFPNPEDSYTEIADHTNLPRKVIVNVFNAQLDFLISKGIAADGGPTQQ